jgi:hypothetical protein
MDVAADAVIANDDEIALFAQLAVPKVEPLWIPMNDPVNEPVLTLNVIDVAAEAVVANDADVVSEDVPANDDVVANDADTGTKVMDVAALAVVANDADTGTKVMDVAAEAVVANDDDVEVVASPNNEPVNELAETFP